MADMVNNPSHYEGDGIDCIDAIRAMLGKRVFIDYCRANAVKYEWRSPKKENEARDLSKAITYLTFALEELKDE